MPTSEEIRVIKEMLRRIAGECAAKTPVVLKNPTCHVKYMGDFTATHDFTRWECEKCGAYIFTPREFVAPRYCQRCGARLVRDYE